MNTGVHFVNISLRLLACSLSLALIAFECAATEIGSTNGVPPGYTLFEGDIVIPTNSPLAIRQDNGIQPAAIYPRRGSTRYWPNGIVPFLFKNDVTQANRTRALAAMAEWEAVANIDFIPRTGHPDYIVIRNSSGNSSAVGRQGGAQWVSINSWLARFVIVHELGHALGYWHEQSRSDRNDYIQVNWDNIQDGKEHNFTKEEGARYYRPYDFDSLMHYGSCAFSTCAACSYSDPNCRTITVLQPYDTPWQNGNPADGEIGQRDHLSHWDATIMSFLYPYDDWRFADSSNSRSGDGTFLDPYRSLMDAVSSVPSGGTIWIEPGHYSATYLFAKPMTWKSALGGVTIGD